MSFEALLMRILSASLLWFSIFFGMQESFDRSAKVLVGISHDEFMDFDICEIYTDTMAYFATNIALFTFHQFPLTRPPLRLNFRKHAVALFNGFQIRKLVGGNLAGSFEAAPYIQQSS